MKSKSTDPLLEHRPVPRFVFLAALIALVFLFAPKFVQLLSIWLSDSILYSDDIFSQVTYLSRCSAVGQFSEDYVGQYVFDVLFPFGYRTVFCSLAYLIHPYVVARVLALLLLSLWLISSILVARKIGCRWSLLLVMAFALSSDFLFLQIAGGLAHSFSIPLIAFFIYCVVSKRNKLVWILVPFSALFYPIICPLFGFYLFFNYLFFGGFRKGQRKRTLVSLVLAALLSFLSVVPTLMQTQYGERVDSSMLTSFPEASELGRYDAFSTPPFPNILEEFVIAIEYAFHHGGRASYVALEELELSVAGPISLSVLVILFLFGLFSINERENRFKIVLLLASCCSSYVFASILYPHMYFPGRAIEHCVSVLALILVPLGLESVFYLRIFSPTTRLNCSLQGVFLILTSICIPLFDGVFLPISLEQEKDKGLFDFVSSQPDQMLIAGWMKGRINWIPYVTQKSAYLSYETHQALHTEYILESRKRAELVIDAIYGSDVEVIFKLRAEGVTHLLIERQYDSAGNVKYFEPFVRRIKQRLSESTIGGYAYKKLPKQAIVFRSDEYLLYDLRLIGPVFSMGSDGSDCLG